jgi:excisionase family DNA binding protein
MKHSFPDHTRATERNGTERTHTTVSIEDLVRAVVSDAIQQALAPYLRKLTLPEPKTYSTTQAAIVLGVCPDTIADMVEDGRLPRVPSIPGKILVPRWAVDQLADGEDPRVG